MTLKDVYANYDTRAPDMLQGVVYAGFSGCDAEQIPGTSTIPLRRVPLVTFIIGL